MFGRLFFGFLPVFAALGAVGLLQKRREASSGQKQEPAEALSERTVENVLDLNDRFNRARYMDKDGE